MTQLITINKIKEIIPISANIDGDLLTPSITLTQTKYIKPILGKLLYEDILTKYSNQTLNAIETALVEIVQIALAQYIVDNTLPFLQYQVTSNGLTMMAGINVESADNKSDMTALSYLRNHLQNTGEFYLTQIQQYLEDNKLNLTLYATAGNDADNTSQYDCGVAFFPNNLTNRRTYFL